MQLAKELRNTGDFYSGLRPSAQVLRQFIRRLDKDKVVSFYERFVKSVRHFKRFGKIVVAIDATIIEVFGNYEDAEWLYDHDQNKYVRGYKLYFSSDADSDWKWARVTIPRSLVNKRKKDPKTGEVITETHVQHSIYMTNILDGRFEDVIKTYGQRVAIENFFEELKNAYFIKGFPNTSRDSVEVSIVLTLLAQLLLWLFCSFLSTNSGDHPYCHKELTSLKLDVLERPIADLFDETEPVAADVLSTQRAIERDIAFIRDFRRFIQRTKPGPPKISFMSCIQG